MAKPLVQAEGMVSVTANLPADHRCHGMTGWRHIRAPHGMQRHIDAHSAMTSMSTQGAEAKCILLGCSMSKLVQVTKPFALTDRPFAPHWQELLVIVNLGTNLMCTVPKMHQTAICIQTIPLRWPLATAQCMQGNKQALRQTACTSGMGITATTAVSVACVPDTAAST